jgi:SAM-dependent methyltransferase
MTWCSDYKQKNIKYVTYQNNMQHFITFLWHIMQDIFTKYFETNFRADGESVSWPWSNSEQSKYIVRMLPDLFDKFDIKSILDIPCGDFNRMQKIDFSYIKYIGADIVDPLIAQNKKRYPNTEFKVLDIKNDKLPKCDLVLVRDCLVHFSNIDIFKALQNICNSWSKYLLVTCFPNRMINEQIETWSRHTINFEQAPFNFPKPIQTINEACTEGGGIYTEKSLCLWEIEQIKSVLSNK